MTKILSYLSSLVLLVCITNFSIVHAQADQAIGEWESHLSYFITQIVTQSDEKVYYATDQSIMILDKDDMSIEFLTRIEGLSQTGIQNILYDQDNDQLIIAYTNSVVDIVTNDGIITITDIRDQADIQGDKLIYDMYIQNGSKLYMATGFGLVEYDLINFEFGFTMDISQRIRSIDGVGDILMIALDDPLQGQVGAYQLDLTTTNTPGFFPLWEEITAGLPSNYEARDVYRDDTNSYVALETSLYVSENGDDYQLIYESDFEDFVAIFLDPTPTGIMLGLQKTNPLVSGRAALIFFDENNTLTSEVTNCIRNMRDACVDSDGRIFFSEFWRNISFLESTDGPCVPVVVNSPFENDARSMDARDGRIYVASGGVRENFGDEFSRDGVYIFQENEWTNVNEFNTEFLRSNEVLQLFQIAASPRGDKVYFGSFWAGVVEYDVETQSIVELYNRDNSSLQFQQGDSRVRISGLGFDDDNTLWVSNFGALEPLSAFSEEGEWHSFGLDRSDIAFLSELDVDDNQFVWVAVGGASGGVLVYDKGQDLADTSDDRQVFLNQGNTEIPSGLVNTVKVDRTGAVWVGTAAGAVVFECGGSAFDGNCIGTRRRVQVDNITAFLLESEDVLSIAVDGANRKWFGTRNGIFVQSPNGEDQISRFSVSNSPLFNNTIRSMTFDDETGIMYIGTDSGIQSIRTETTGSRAVHESNVFAFPNPVRAEYNGPIAIRGLATDAEVRITDIDGHLVFKTTALGGQAIWDGKDFHGSDVASGVYLVFSSSTDTFRDIDSHVTKILIVR